MHWYIKVLKNYSVFEGRARRKEYWMFSLINLLIVMIIGFLSVVFANLVGETMLNIFTGIYVLYMVAVFLPGIAVTVRRLHDSGHSGWWFLTGLIPFVGTFVLLVFMVLDSEPGTNRYGTNPKGAVV